MKRLAFLVFAAVLAGSASAQMKGMDMKDMDMKSEKKAEKGTVHKATGVVTKVDSTAGKVTIKHEPVQSMKWPAMTMAFLVKDKAMLDKLAKDKKVDFEFVQRGKDYVVTSVK
jgi:Cu(I)/Ag(I) efflux system periplasmic protein CusF